MFFFLSNYSISFLDYQNVFLKSYNLQFQTLFILLIIEDLLISISKLCCSFYHVCCWVHIAKKVFYFLKIKLSYFLNLTLKLFFAEFCFWKFLHYYSFVWMRCYFVVIMREMIFNLCTKNNMILPVGKYNLKIFSVI